MKVCAVDSCDQPAAKDRDVCSPCWATVPPYLTAAYWRNYRVPGFTNQWIRGLVIEAATKHKEAQPA